MTAVLANSGLPWVGRSRPLFLESLRIGIWLVVLFATVTLQTVQSYFVNLESILPIYFIVTAACSIHTWYLFEWERLKESFHMQVFVFAVDTVCVAALLFSADLSQTFFLFLFFIQIFLAGMCWGRAGGLIMSAWVSILYSVVLVFDASYTGQGLILALVLNNFAFYCTGYLSGALSQQLLLLGDEIRESKVGMQSLQDMHRSLVDQVDAGITTVDKDGKIGQFNRRFASYVGASDVDLEGQTITDLLPLSEALFQEEMWSKNDKGEYEGRRFELEISNLEEQTLFLKATVSPLLSDGIIIGFILLIHDETQVRNLEASIRQSEKLAAVGQLAAGIAHEIRNPLASISGSIQLLESLPTDADERGRLMRIVLREIDRLNGLISEFLDYVRPGEELKEEVNLSKLTLEVLDMVKLNDKLNQETHQVSQVESDLIVRGDEGKLKQAVLNILINAYQAMEKVERPEVRLTLVQVKSAIRLSIRDNGCGMDANQVKKIFEPFHTTKPKGTGLGLAMTHKILEIHKAVVTVKSEKNIGTEFILDFPRVSNLDVTLKKQDN